MSRTYRRNKFNPDWVNYGYCSLKATSIFSDEMIKYPKIPSWKYHGDFSCYGKRHTHNWKHQADRKRRQDNREQINNIKKEYDLEYFDFINYEKKYSGFAWYWD